MSLRVWIEGNLMTFCKNCNGRGFSMEDTLTGTYEEVHCSECDGTGNDDCIWRADTKNDSVNQR